MQLNTINEEEFIDKFIRGLKSNTRTELEFRDPKTIAEAVKWADTFDARYYHNRANQCYYSSFSSNISHQKDNRGEPMQLDTLRTTDHDASLTIQIDALKTKPQLTKLTKLTEEERTHLCNIGACFKCRKQGYMARECLNKVGSKLGNLKRQ